MSLKKVRQVKKEKFFRPADLILYGAIIAALAILFTALFWTKKDSSPEGVRIYVRDEIVFEYFFAEDRYEILNGCAEVVAGDALTVEINAEGGYNIVEIDKSARTARVVGADCRSRDCVFSPPVSSVNDFIYCMPHHLRILPFGYEEDGKTVIM